jgi:hypothetical protein
VTFTKQAGIQWPFTVDSQVRSQADICGFMVEKLALGQVSQYFGFPLSVIFQLSPALCNLGNQERL